MRQHGNQHHQCQPQAQACGDAGTPEANEWRAPPYGDHPSLPDLECLATTGALTVHARIELLRRLHLGRAGLGAHGHVAAGLAVFQNGSHMGHDPVVVAILAAVLHHATPMLAAPDGGPHVLECLGRHVGVANQVVRLTQKLLAGKAADARKRLVAMGDNTLGIGGGNQHFTAGVVVFPLGNGLVVAHSKRPRQDCCHAARTCCAAIRHSVEQACIYLLIRRQLLFFL